MYDVNAEYDIETFEFKLKALCTNETYYRYSYKQSLYEEVEN